MVFKGAATMFVRISRALISHHIKPRFSPHVHELPQITKNPEVYSKNPTRFYLFPSVYRSFFSYYGPSIGHYQQNLSNLMPFRAALNEIKRRLFFAGLYFVLSFFYSLFRIYAYHYPQFVYTLKSNEKQRRRRKEEFFVVVLSYDCIKKQACAT
jgi:hypothetical protein